ncbi:MAG: peptide/nickel transport system substrate-binding protein [Pseudonocardiales bacterium]|nr:peptide/nickel transport system substrate-binding protein [Pseudonocardiales bacterium]
MGLTRRQFLWAGSGVAATTVLAACGVGDGDDTAAKPAAGAAGTPRRGGTLRVGALGRAAAITRDPHGSQVNESDYLITSLRYDTLTVPAARSNTARRLASNWASSADLRTWRFTIAKDAAFHDGGPVTAADVAWSLRRLRSTPAGAARLPGIRAENIRAEGARTVVLVSDYPNNALPLLTRLTTFVLPKGTADSAIATAPGSGPFKLDWFRDGNARLVRNDAWHGGRVLLDAIEVRIFESPQAMSNALLAGQIDVASNVGAVAARAAVGRPDVRIIQRRNDMAMPIVMRTADGPFADQRVREALRLAVDRDAMVRQVLSGYGAIGNDVLGAGDPIYAVDLPQRRRDLDTARRLLAEAKFDLNWTYDLLTTEDVAGLAESATLFATHLAEAGVKIKVVKQDSAVFWDKSWLKAPLYTTYWGTNDSVLFFASKTLVSDAGQNETAFADKAFDAAYRKAISSNNPSETKQSLHELQTIEYDRSGYLLWGMADGIDLSSAQVRGLPELPGYGRVQLERAWLAG